VILSLVVIAIRMVLSAQSLRKQEQASATARRSVRRTVRSVASATARRSASGSNWSCSETSFDSAARRCSETYTVTVIKRSLASFIIPSLTPRSIVDHTA
jgi:septal ring-binding cell division protein DamX